MTKLIGVVVLLISSLALCSCSQIKIKTGTAKATLGQFQVRLEGTNKHPFNRTELIPEKPTDLSSQYSFSRSVNYRYGMSVDTISLQLVNISDANSFVQVPKITIVTETGYNPPDCHRFVCYEVCDYVPRDRTRVTPTPPAVPFDRDSCRVTGEPPKDDYIKW